MLMIKMEGMGLEMGKFRLMCLRLRTKLATRHLGTMAIRRICPRRPRRRTDAVKFRNSRLNDKF